MIQNPHDSLFKAVFGQLEHARSLLRAILPAHLADAIDWAQLTPCPGAFVDLVQPPRYADLLFATRWRSPAAAPLHLLFEHQSSPSAEDLMAHRLLRYMGRSWDQWRTDHPRARTLPAIIPVVLYHGKLPWPEPRALHALLEVPAPLRPACEPHLVRFEYLLHDLSALSADELCAGDLLTPLAKLVTVCFKYAWAGPPLLAVLDRSPHLVRGVARAPAGRESLEQVIRYILEVAEPIEERELRALLDRALEPQPKDTLMTLAEQYIEKGRKEGAEQARLSAEQARQALPLRLVRKRFGAAVDATIEERIARASREQVEDSWADRVLSAATIDEMFAPRRLTEQRCMPGAKQRLDKYPHQCSGGMRQRAMIAMALSCEPKLLIADEPTTALDVTIQAQIVELVKRLQDELGMAVMWITHDLGVVAELAQTINVMYAGFIIERGDVHDIYKRTRHPYTLGLLGSLPRLDEAPGTKLVSIPGLPPDLVALPKGCPFYARCVYAAEKCQEGMPPLQDAGDIDHLIACWRWEEIARGTA